jgi:hypothetical protein
MRATLEPVDIFAVNARLRETDRAAEQQVSGNG